MTFDNIIKLSEYYKTQPLQSFRDGLIAVRQSFSDLTYKFYLLTPAEAGALGPTITNKISKGETLTPAEASALQIQQIFMAVNNTSNSDEFISEQFFSQCIIKKYSSNDPGAGTVIKFKQDIMACLSIERTAKELKKAMEEFCAHNISPHVVVPTIEVASPAPQPPEENKDLSPAAVVIADCLPKEKTPEIEKESATPKITHKVAEVLPQEAVAPSIPDGEDENKGLAAAQSNGLSNIKMRKEGREFIPSANRPKHKHSIRYKETKTVIRRPDGKIISQNRRSHRGIEIPAATVQSNDFPKATNIKMREEVEEFISRANHSKQKNRIRYEEAKTIIKRLGGKIISRSGGSHRRIEIPHIETGELVIGGTYRPQGGYPVWLELVVEVLERATTVIQAISA